MCCIRNVDRSEAVERTGSHGGIIARKLSVLFCAQVSHMHRGAQLYQTRQGPSLPSDITLAPLADDFRRLCFAM